MNTQTDPDPQATVAHNTLCVSWQLVYSYCTVEVVVFWAFPLSLKVHAHLQCPSVYYHRDPLDDVDHLVDPTQEKRLAG